MGGGMSYNGRGAPVLDPLQHLLHGYDKTGLNAVLFRPASYENQREQPYHLKIQFIRHEDFRQVENDVNLLVI